MSLRNFIDNLITALDAIDTTSYRTEPNVEYGIKTLEETSNFPKLWVYAEQEKLTEQSGQEEQQDDICYIVGYVHSEESNLPTQLENLYQDVIEKIQEDDTFSDSCNYVEIVSETAIMNPYGIFIIKKIPNLNKTR